MSRSEASKMIKAIMHRRGVIKELIAYGYEKKAAWRLSVKEAHGALSAMKRASRSA